MRCETTGGFEDCVNCPSDCGMCALNSCGESLTCVFSCIDFGGGGGIPSFSLSCLAGCVAQTCTDSRFFLDQVVNCAIGNIGTCTDFSCIMSECRTEIAACLADRC
jgi:hypothetical protein